MVDKKENSSEQLNVNTEINDNPNTALENVVSSMVDNVPPPSAAVLPSNVIPPAAPPPPSVPSGKRGRGRPPKDSSTVQKPKIERPRIEGAPARPISVASPAMGQQQAGIEASAATAVMFINMSGMALGGAEGAMRDEEKLMAFDGFKHYFQVKGVNNVPTWVVLAGALMPYYMRVISQTPAKNKVAFGIGMAWRGIKKLFGKLSNAHIHRRNDNEREDNAGEAGSDGDKGKGS